MEPFIKVLQAQNIQDIYIKTIDYTTKHCMCYLIIVYKRGELRLGKIMLWQSMKWVENHTVKRADG